MKPVEKNFAWNRGFPSVFRPRKVQTMASDGCYPESDRRPNPRSRRSVSHGGTVHRRRTERWPATRRPVETIGSALAAVSFVSRPKHSSGKRNREQQPSMTSHRIYLIGYRGTGKTTVGKMIAEQTGGTFVDLDAEIERISNQTIQEIFRDSGEAVFRDRETECLTTVAADQVGTADAPQVVSLGGGVILRPQNRVVIEETGWCVCLTAAAKTLVDRISQDRTTSDKRPALTDLSPEQEVAHLLSERDPLYREAADVLISTDGKTPQAVAEEIIHCWQSGDDPAN
ncbi:shikimate kinase [Roseiconus nitratireducens]|uniref:Shikimate kinase n=2 Tax=Roseiconus nitratireducens TaxID=2605748 RepID=A0A5M6CZ61_9BACT|nr:shikimate kinase [Roseiconus nitratireducens]